MQKTKGFLHTFILFIYRKAGDTHLNNKKKKEDKNIDYYTLTGQTPSMVRVQMAEEFNKPNSSQKVFLISLKAGGTGLNLVGADTVIQLDPWWNISAENQASDRAHRIGQKNIVQVIKIICENSDIKITEDALKIIAKVAVAVLYLETPLLVSGSRSITKVPAVAVFNLPLLSKPFFLNSPSTV